MGFLSFGGQNTTPQIATYKYHKNKNIEKEKSIFFKVLVVYTVRTAGVDKEEIFYCCIAWVYQLGSLI
jgi:hypothetical protein